MNDDFINITQYVAQTFVFYTLYLAWDSTISIFSEALENDQINYSSHLDWKIKLKKTKL